MKGDDTLTLIVVTAAQVVRADFARSAKTPTDLWQAGRPAGTPLAVAVGTALNLAGRPGAVWILAEDCWAQQATLSVAQTAGLTAGELSRALAFEVEPFTGIASGQAALGFLAGAPQHGSRAHDVVQLRAADRDALLELVIKAGGRLMGISHPSAHKPALFTSRGRSGGDVPVISQDSGVLQSWLADWAHRLHRNGEGVPWIPPPEQKPTNRPYFQTAGALLLGVAALGLAARFWYAHRLDAARHQQASFEAAGQRSAQLVRQSAGLKSELAALDQEQEEMDRLKQQRRAMSTLLLAMSRCRTADVMLQRVDPAGPGMLDVSGLALEAMAVDEMGVVLNQPLREVGWHAQPLAKKALNRQRNGGPWEFTLRLAWGDPARPGTAPSTALPNHDE